MGVSRSHCEEADLMINGSKVVFLYSDLLEESVYTKNREPHRNTNSWLVFIVLYGIFIYIDHTNQPNADNYTIPQMRFVQGDSKSSPIFLLFDQWAFDESL